MFLNAYRDADGVEGKAKAAFHTVTYKQVEAVALLSEMRATYLFQQYLMACCHSPLFLFAGDCIFPRQF